MRKHQSNSALTRIVCAGTAAIMAATAMAATEVVDGITWTYTVSNDKASVGSGSDKQTAVPSSTSGSITIPSALGGYPVTSIGDYAFYWCSDLTSVTIPNSVTNIGNYAFYECFNLASVTIPASVRSIGKSAFYNAGWGEWESVHIDISNLASWCAIQFADSGANPLSGYGRLYLNGVEVTSLTIPDSVTSIGNYAFYGCDGLTSITIPNSVRSIGDYAFSGCSGLPSVTIPNSLTSIGDYAFRYCRGLTNATIGNSVRSIGDYAFSGCEGLTSVTIPDSVTSVGDGAFHDCNGISSIVLNGDVFTGANAWFQDVVSPSWLFEKAALELVLFPLQYMANWRPVLDECGLEDVAVPLTPINLGGCVLREEIVDGKTWRFYIKGGNAVVCSGDWGNAVTPVKAGQTITVPNSLGGYPVTEIGWLAFAGMGKNMKVVLPESVTRISDYAFYNCAGLASITIPKGVRSIGDYAFANCYGLSQVTFSGPSSLATVGEAAFRWCVSLADSGLTLPSSATNVGKNALQLALPLELSGEVHGALRPNAVHTVSGETSVPKGKVLRIPLGTFVKFRDGVSLMVSGRLEATGSRIQPVVFTSIRDDAHGGDTNRDGDATKAQPGDWDHIWVEGKATFDYCSILYCSATENHGGIEASGGVVTFDNSEIAHSLYECVNAPGGGTFTAHNSAFWDGSLGFGFYGEKNVRAYNCVFHGLTTAIRERDKQLVNCVFSDCQSFTDQEGDGSTFDHCLFWNPAGSGPQSYSKVGSHGNVWGDPLFLDSDAGDFRIAEDSPCVDAGAAAFAPELDAYGQRRCGAPDIGLYEVQNGNVPAADLVVVSVSAPPTLTVGKSATISWTVKNIGEETAVGLGRNGSQWQDSIDLVSANGQVFPIVVTNTPVGMELAPGESATFSAVLRIPAAPEGAVRVRVTANSRRDVPEGIAHGNNSGFAEATLIVGQLQIQPNGGAVSVHIPAEADAGYSLSVPGGASGVLMVQGAGEFDAWLGNGSLSAKDNAVRTAVQIADDRWLLQIPAGSAPRVTFANGGLSEATAQVSLRTGDFFLFDVGTISAANSGIVSVPFAGNGFGGAMECWLERGGVRIDATDIVVESEVTARAVFDVTGRASGDWTLHVRNGGNEYSVAGLSLTDSRVGPLWFCGLDMPSAIRQDRAYVGTLRYGNTGDVAMAAAYVRLEAKGDTLIRMSEADAWAKSIEILAASDTSPASMLKAGESSSVAFFFKTSGDMASISQSCTLSCTNAFPWTETKTDLRPSWASGELWDFAFATLRHNFGETWDDYLDRLRADCDHLLKIGSPTKRLDRILQLELNDALGIDAAVPTLASATDLARGGRGMGLSLSRTYASSLRGRLSSGILGYGWTDNYSSYAELLDDETLVFHLPSGGSYSFTKASGEWKPQDARDKTELTETSSAYILTYRSGTVQIVAKAGAKKKTTSIRDALGNTLSFTYSGDKLTKVAHSDGQTLTLTYSGGKLTKATDDQGRSVTYDYNGDLLTSVTAFDGLVTRYEYHAADNTPLSRALTRIIHPDGTTTEFEYDDSGLLRTTSANGGQLATRIERGVCGSYTVIAPNGGRTEVTVGASGETLKTVNAKGEIVRQTYSADTLLESTIAPSGRRSTITHDRDGNPVTASSASGATTAFSLESDFGNLASVTDAKGHAFRYGYDDSGRNVSIAYADGSEATVAYDEHGDLVCSTNRRGESVDFEYDAEGNLTKKTWPNGRTFTFVYDAKGNVTTAADSETGSVTMEYDEHERMKRIVYPKGRGFTFAYDEAGRMIERTLLGGSPSSATATQRFSYDAFGRLATVTDGDGNAYLANAYDPATGWLVTQTYGNGTVVSNAYDLLGRTIGIYHGRDASTMRPPWLAFFEYEYDEDGRCVSQTTDEGVESYTYDADGQLTGVTYPDGTSETFAYDAVGNRITSGGAGGSPAEMSYTVNALNQYTSILRDSATPREETFTYDRDGNLTSRTDADGTTTYTYDILNRLVAVTNETKNIRWSCEYDVFGNRVSVTDNGVTTEKVFLQGSLPSVAAEYDADGNLSTRHILVGAVRLASGGAGGSLADTRYYHGDIIGSTRLLTDGMGAAKGRRSFKAFGETRVSTGETTGAGYVGTLGIETDPTGLLFMRNRYYDAGMGRFVQMDPIGLDGEDVNLYSYVCNSPICAFDASGLLLEDSSLWRGLKTTLTCVAAGAGVASFIPVLAPVTAPIAAASGLLASAMTCFEKADKSYHDQYTLQDDIDVISEFGTLGLTAGISAKTVSHMRKAAQHILGKTFFRYRNHGRFMAHKDIAGIMKDTVDTLINVIPKEIYDAFKDDCQPPFDPDWDFDWELNPKISWDPNEIVGTAGVGAKRYVEPADWLDYTIYFENKAEATAAAQEVFIDLPMDPNLDWTTLELGEVVFGENIDRGLAGKSHGTSRYPLPGTNTFVVTTVRMVDDVLSWYIRDWDPTTADNFPADAEGGFLPPNVKDEDSPDFGCGEGRVTFRVRVKDDAPRGARINASAQIIFDRNDMIETDPSWFNTVGRLEPVTVDFGDGATTNLLFAVGEPYGELPVPEEREGVVFAGWFTGENGTGTRVTAETVFDGSLTSLHAYWTTDGVLPTVGDLYVDAATGSDANDGRSWKKAKKSIQAAINASVAGDLILVNDGRYEPISTGGRDIVIRSVSGPEATIIDASLQWPRGVTNRCAALGSSYYSSTLDGFCLTNGIATYGGGACYGILTNCFLTGNTATNGGGVAYGIMSDCRLWGNKATFGGGGSYYGVLSNCVFIGNNSLYGGGGSYNGTLFNCGFLANSAGTYGGGSYYGMLDSCTLIFNSAASGGGSLGGTLNRCTLNGNNAKYYGGGARGSTLNNCVLRGNKVQGNYGGGVYYGTLNNCTLSGNSASNYGGGSCYATLNNCIVWGNSASSGPETYGSYGFRTCSSDDLRGVGNIVANPLFVDASNGNLRLQTGSPCIDAGWMPWAETVGTDHDGNIRWQGIQVDMGAFEFAGTTFSPTFREPKTLYVDASGGDDGNGGNSWSSAKKSIQAAVEEARHGDTILVAPGLYSPIATMDLRIRIVSRDGARTTIIDGGGSIRSATLGTTTNTVLQGFSLRNGHAYQGGGSAYGTLDNCMLYWNTADSDGGGVYSGVQNNCLLMGNTATYGGGAYYSMLNNCCLSGNVASYGGGEADGTLFNCTLSGNRASNEGGGSWRGMLNNCIVWGNSAQTSNAVYRSTCRYSCLAEPVSGTGNININPRFVDAASGDYRLQSGSPCINAGLNDYATGNTDCLGNARIVGGVVDMGAYEFNPDAPAITCIVTFDAQNGTGGTASVTATYGSIMPAISVPTLADYGFGGYWTGRNGTGIQYYTATGTSARRWDRTSAMTLYAYWIAPQPIFRFYSKGYKGHFFTINEEEKNSIIASNPNWKFEGSAYKAFAGQVLGTVALHRFYSKAYKGHFFTINEEEKETIRQTNPNWKYEGIAYYVYPSAVEGSVPVFRFWSKGYRHHFYTTSVEEKDNLIATNPNWKYEGEAFWAIPDNTGNQKAAKGMAFDSNVGNDGNDGQDASDENDGNDRNDGFAGNDANAGNGASADVGEHSLASAETGVGVSPWSLAAWPDCEPVALEGVTEVGGLVVETRTAAPELEDLPGGDGSTSRPLALPLLLSLPDGAWRATLRSAVGGAVADEDATGVFGFTLPANGAWHWLRVRDEDDAEATDTFSLWLRAE